MAGNPIGALAAVTRRSAIANAGPFPAYKNGSSSERIHQQNGPADSFRTFEGTIAIQRPSKSR
jgi:hypothetical protein